MHVKVGSAKAAPAKSKIMAPNVGGRNKTLNLGKSNIALKEGDESMAPNIENQPAPETKDVRLVSCYRSGGAMPIPRQAAEKKFPKWKPKIPTLNLQSYTEDQEDVTEEVVEEFMSDKVDMSAAVIEEEQDDDFHVAVVLVVKVLEDALPPPKPKQQNCKKHSRCHCDMLSLDTTDFFTIQV